MGGTMDTNRQEALDAVVRFQQIGSELEKYADISPADDNVRYFCTPQEAIPFASLGFDGIHFCLMELPEKSGTYRVVQVNPAAGEERLRLVADSLDDFVSLLMKVPFGGNIYTASYQDRASYEDAIERSNREVEEWGMEDGLIKLRKKLAMVFHVRPISDPFDYIDHHVSIGRTYHLPQDFEWDG